MYPIKNHRIVRHGAAMVASGRDRRDAALEAAENEGWPPQWPPSTAMRCVGKEAIVLFPAFQAAPMRAGE